METIKHVVDPDDGRIAIAFVDRGISLIIDEAESLRQIRDRFDEIYYEINEERPAILDWDDKLDANAKRVWYPILQKRGDVPSYLMPFLAMYCHHHAQLEANQNPEEFKENNLGASSLLPMAINILVGCAKEISEKEVKIHSTPAGPDYEARTHVLNVKSDSFNGMINPQDLGKVENAMTASAIQKIKMEAENSDTLNIYSMAYAIRTIQEEGFDANVSLSMRYSFD